MSDLKLFNIQDGKAIELNTSIVAKERNIQRLVEEKWKKIKKYNKLRYFKV